MITLKMKRVVLRGVRRKVLSYWTKSIRPKSMILLSILIGLKCRMKLILTTYMNVA